MQGKRACAVQVCPCASKKPRRQMLRPGDYVTWHCTDTNQQREAQVLRHDGEMVVLSDHTSMFTLRPATLEGLARTDWRANVCAGDALFVRVPGCDRQPAIVRATGKMLTLEPAFLGKTMQVPLTSTTLSCAHPDAHPHVRALIASGLAFDHAYSSTHSVHAIGNVTTPCTISPTESWDALPAWEIAAPCALPADTRLLRTEAGSLMLCHDADVTQNEEANSAPPTRVRMGVVSVRVHPESDETTSESLNLHLFHQHLRNGDFELAARVMCYQTERIVNDDQLSLALVQALALSACHPLYANTSDDYHPVSRRVWQHSSFHIAGMVNSDLEALTQSAMRMKYICPIADRAALDNFILRMHIWTHYKQWWGNARKIQLFYEARRPVEARILGVRSSGGDCALEFEVFAHVSHRESLVNPLGHENAVYNLRHVTAILDHFTPPIPCWNPTQRREFVRTAPVSWQSAVAMVSSVPDGVCLEKTVLRREKLNVSGACLTHRAVLADHVVPWNVCQGPVWDDNAPELHRGGVVMVHNCPRRKVQDVARILRAEMQGQYVPTPADRGSTLIVTTPTLMCDWQRQLNRHGVPSHVFCGSGRRGPGAMQCLQRGDVLILTYRALCHFDDLRFLRRVDPSPWRIVLDELTVAYNSPFMRTLVRWKEVPHVWMLTQKPTKDVLAFALALFRVRPFSLEDTFGGEHDFRRHTYIQSLLSTRMFSDAPHDRLHQDAPHNRLHQDALFVLCKSLFVNRAQRKRVVRSNTVAHAVGDGYGDAQRRTFLALRDDFYKVDPDGRRKLKHHSASGYQKYLRTMHLCAWGVPPPLAMVSTKVTSGNYSLDAAQHAARLRTSPLDSRRKAARLCDALHDNSPLPDEVCCSVCMEPLGTADELSNDPATQVLQTAVVVGTCGHTLCGVCADQIHRVASENRATNDYGSNAPINRPSCPVCRQAWDLQPPLLYPTRPGVWFRRHQQHIFHMRCRVQPCAQSPLISALRRALCSLHHEQSPSPKSLVVCHSSELTRFLHAEVDDNVRPSSKLEGNMPPLSRGKALADFRQGITPTLFVTASLLRGLFFQNVEHIFVAECLSVEEKEYLDTLIRTANPPATTVHTFNIPVLSPATSAATVGVAGIPTLPKTRPEYIQNINFLFGEHTNSLEV